MSGKRAKIIRKRLLKVLAFHKEKLGNFRYYYRRAKKMFLAGELSA